AGYVKGLNTAVKKVNEAMDSGDFSLIKHWEREMAFHGAGHFLHNLFWSNMGPSTGKRSTTLNRYINQSFGSFDRFISLFKQASISVEGGGWGILAYQPDGDRLVVLQAEKHQNQTQWITIPILVCDVWEHAYYLKYQNKRGDYVNGFLQVVNWDHVSELLEQAIR
ncbi:MAG: superoxide dismutase, partial [Bacteroidales bacterium]|nr:superoxide dismutase [Bacteroidales bacterium]